MNWRARDSGGEHRTVERLVALPPVEVEVEDSEPGRALCEAPVSRPEPGEGSNGSACSRPENDRRVLIISYHYPPDGAVGAIRAAKFAKYLGLYGWAPQVLSVTEQRTQTRDCSRLAEVSAIPVHRTAEWPTVLGAALALKRRLSATIAGPPREAGDAPEVLPERRAGILIRTLKRYLNSVFELPDRHIGWLLPAVWRGYRLARREGSRLILASSPPKTTALVGLYVSRLAGIPLVTDLRDPWFFPDFKDPATRSLLSDTIEARLEKAIIRKSRFVVTTTDHYGRHLQERYPDLPAERFRTISNGYDADDFRGLERREPGEKFTISYLGSFYLGRTPTPVLQALGELVKEKVIPLDRLAVRFVGDVRASGDLTDGLVTACGLSGSVVIQDPVPYRSSLERMKESHVLLLLAPDQYYCIPAKAYEYLGAGRRILCLAREGATADLIRGTAGGLVLDPDDVAGIKHALRRLYQEFRSDRIHPPPLDATRFERKNLTRELAEALESASS